MLDSSQFYSYLTRLRWIKRWGLMRNSYEENVMEHSWEVAIIANTLSVISNEYYGGKIDTNAVTVAALYHDVTEVITGDLPTPIKYHSKAIKDAYKNIEQVAADELCNLLPERLKNHFIAQINYTSLSEDEKELIKYADRISAYLKCQSEINAGNIEFRSVAEMLARKINSCNRPEVEFFIRIFASESSSSFDALLLAAEDSIC